MSLVLKIQNKKLIGILCLLCVTQMINYLVFCDLGVGSQPSPPGKTKGLAPLSAGALVTITVGKASLKVELARTPEEHERGLMYRRHLPDHQGMLFIFPDEQRRTFWMKNTFIPLSLGFFDKEGVLRELGDLDPVTSEMQTQIPRWESKHPAQFVLEVNRGWFKRNGIKIGDRLKLPPEIKN
ncbi:MAG: DUF192 domain-containing protein [Bdellovibrionaceae bacterium]|nr:DUF192 domain-containing protein [Pseudobdellovibrionaceae bacterium]MDW8190281.1 DUF192 domain-containing protein [Pseudobdellovibrionaceae bacterium]